MATANSSATLGLDQNGLIDESKLPEPKVGDEPILGKRYYSPEFMQKEWDHMWTKVWLVAGLEEEISKPGDRMTFEIGQESILCTRDEDGKVRVFYNVCQHRGNKLVHDEYSSGKQMMCAYHGWRYKVNGELSFVPQKEDYPQGDPCGKLRLKELRSEVCGGFIWYSMNDDAPSLQEYLGPVYAQINTYDLKRFKRTHWVTVEGEFNWKIVQDNFNESYHLPYVHPSTKHVMEQNYKHCQMDVFEKEGHARMIMPGSRPTLGFKGGFDETLKQMKNDFDFWDVDGESFRDDPHSIREAMQKIKREKGAEKGFDFSGLTDDQLTDHFHYTIFPNFSLSLKPDGAFFLMARPHESDPGKCIFDAWFLNWFPDGTTEYYSAAMFETISFDDPVPHIKGKVGEVSCGKVIDEDLSVWTTQQKGLKSKGYDGGYLTGQETRVRFFHEELDRYISKGETQKVRVVK
eukprot:g16866.t1